jgi:hypothetical protein
MAGGAVPPEPNHKGDVVSNIVEVSITATVPWDWAGRLPDSEAACFAGLLLNSVIGVQLRQEDVGYRRNEHGGRTHMVRMHLYGTEALSWIFMSRLVYALGLVGEVTQARAKDVQWEHDPGVWEPIEAEYYAEWCAKNDHELPVLAERW